MSIVVFLGPSLPRSKAMEILPGAIYLPPAAQIDFMSAVRIHKPTVIALIDGVFEQTPSVWHKEILYALERGISVYGASSMGALRAAETAAFGAIGVGEVYRMVAEGELLDDDEVALSHAGEEFGFRPLTEPMVNVRATLALAREEGLLEPPLHDRLARLAKSQHFSRRTFSSILDAADLPCEQHQALQEFVRDRYVDLKARDAEELLKRLRDAGDQSPTSPSFTLCDSIYFRRQERRERQVARAAGKVSMEKIVGHFALHSDEFEEVYFAAQNVAVAVLMAEVVGVKVTEQDLAREERRFRIWRRIKKADVESWLAANDLEPAELSELVQQRATCRALHRWMNRGGYRSSKSITAVLHELRARGTYPTWADRAARQEATIARDFPDFPQPEDNVEDMDALVLEHLRSTPCRMPLPYQEWRKEAGFLYDDAMKLELLKARLIRKILLSLSGSAP